MSGHSKWANIKRQKEANDKAKGALFAKFSKAITLAVVEGGGLTDLRSNIKLRFAIDQARACNMPKETIERAIIKVTQNNKEILHRVVYEAYSSAGIGILMIGATDNPHRTAAEVRNVLDRHGGKLAVSGAVKRLFEEMIEVKIQTHDENALYEFINRFESREMIEKDACTYTCYIPSCYISKFAELDEIKNITITDSPRLMYYVLSPTEIEKEEDAAGIVQLQSALEYLDDIQHVYTTIL